MAEWIKLSTGMFENRKIKQIEVAPNGKKILLLWVRLLCLAGSINDGGEIYIAAGKPYTVEGLAVELNEAKALVKKALELFEDYGMISYNANGCIVLTGWEKHQNVEGLDRIKEQNRERVRRYRQSKCNADVTDNNEEKVTPCNVTSNVTETPEVTPCNVTETLQVTPCSITVTPQNKNKNKNKRESSSIRITTATTTRNNNNNIIGDPAVAAAAEAIKFWADNTGQFGEVVRSDIADLVAQYGDTFVIEAMRQAIRQNKLKISYVAGAARGIASGEDTRPKKEPMPF